MPKKMKMTEHETTCVREALKCLKKAEDLMELGAAEGGPWMYDCTGWALRIDELRSAGIEIELKRHGCQKGKG